MKRRQSGVTLSGLLLAAVIVAFIALLGMKVAPEVIEYYQIVKAIKKIKNDPSAQESVAQVRRSFENQATIDNITVITPQDLDITKDSGRLIVSFAYERRVHLFGNVSLLLEFQGSTEE